MLGAFNEATPDWLSLFMFTFFTDRDGKMQLESLAQSGFDPLSRTCRFMLTEEAHHMFVGETGIGRVVQRTCLPHVAFHRDIGEFKDVHATPKGELIDDATWAKQRDNWLPSVSDGDFITSLMQPVAEPGKFASWISPPKVGIDNRPGDFEYVKIAA